MFLNPWLNAIARFYIWLVKWASNLQSLFLLWMRLTWGPQFFLMGLDRLKNLGESAFHTHLVGYLELTCGLLLIVGFASRLAAVPLVFITLTVLATFHTPAISEWKFITHPSLIAHEAPYPLLIAALLVLIFGPGKASLDAWIKRWIHKKND